VIRGTDPVTGTVAVDRIVRTVCSPNCSGTCGVNAFVKDGRLLKIEPASFPEPGWERICLKGIAMAMQRIEHPDRIRYPLRRVGPRGGGQWERVSWEEAMGDIAQRLQATADKYGARANSWMTMSGNYGFKATTSPHRIANTLGGTIFTHDGMMGDLNCAIGFLPALGAGFACNDLADLPHARYILIFGRNPADTDHSEMRFLFDAMEAGAKVVVVDPRFSRTAAKADEWVSPRPGTDAALVLGMIQVMDEECLIDEPYVIRHTNGPFLIDPRSGKVLRGEDGEPQVWDGAAVVAASACAEPVLRGRAQVALADGTVLDCPTAFEAMRSEWRRYTPSHVAEVCALPAETVIRLARDYAGNSPAWLWCGAGPQRYHHGHLVHRAYVTLAALAGNIGKPYAGVNTLDGAHMRFVFNAPEAWTAPGGRHGEHLPGVHLLEILSKQEPYPVKSLWIASYGMGTQSPSFDRFVEEALPNLDLFVVTEQMMTGAADHADYVLPCVSYYEEPLDLVAGGEHWFLQLRQQAIPPVGESRNDYAIFADLAHRMGQGEHWSMDDEAACRFILENHGDPAFRAIDLETLRRQGAVRVQIPRPHVPFGDMVFRTPSGKIELYQEQFAEAGEAVLMHKDPLEGRDPRYPLMLVSPKHVHSTHSQHTMLPWIREHRPEPLLEMHPRDAADRGIADGVMVEVWNDRGRFEVRASLNEGVKPGMLVVPQGFWRKHFRRGHFADLGRIERNAVQEAVIETNYPVWDVGVEVGPLALEDAAP